MLTKGLIHKKFCQEGKRTASSAFLEAEKKYMRDC